MAEGTTRLTYIDVYYKIVLSHNPYFAYIIESNMAESFNCATGLGL